MAAGWLLPALVPEAFLSPLTTGLLLILSQLLMFGLPAVLLLAHKRKNIDVWQALKQPPHPLDAGLTMLAAVGYVLTGGFIAVLFYLLLTALGITPALPEPLVPQSVPELLMLTVAVAMVTPICEELFFRETLPLLVSGRLKPWLTALVCSALFASMHFTLAGFPALLLFGLITHWIRVRKGSLLLSIIFHAMYNFSILLMNYMEAEPGLDLSLMSLAVFAIAFRKLLKEENHGNDIQDSGV